MKIIIALLLLIRLAIQPDKPTLLEYEFVKISQIQITENGTYVADYGMKRIYRFDRDGTFIRHVGRTGRGPGEYLRGPNVIIGVGDNFYVADEHPGAINIYDRSLDIVETIIKRDVFFTVIDGFQYADSLLFITGIDLLGTPFASYDLKINEIEEIVIPNQTGYNLMDTYKGYVVDDKMVLIWTYINRVDTFKIDGEHLHSCKLPGLADMVEYYTAYDLYSEDLIKSFKDASMASFKRNLYLTRTGYLIRNTVIFNDLLAVQYGRGHNNDQVLFFNNQCELLGEIELQRTKHLRAIDAENQKLYYSYNENDYQRIGIKDLDINWFD